MKFSEYAKSRHITPQAVYNAINSNKDLFNDHISQNDKGVRVLDPEAVALLDNLIRLPSKRNEIIEKEVTAQLQEAEKQKKDVIIKAQELVIEEQDKTRKEALQHIDKVKQDTETIRDDLKTIKELLEHAHEVEQERDQLRQEVEQLKKELEATKGRKLKFKEIIKGKTCE